MWKSWKLESIPITWMATSWPTLACSVGVLPAKARPLMHWNWRSRPVTGGASEWKKITASTSGSFSPRSRTMIAPKSPRKVFSVWLGPWSW